MAEAESEKELTEEDFMLSAAKCYLQLEKYKLKTNVVSFNLQKDTFYYAYEELEKRTTDRYMNIYDDIESAIHDLYKNFIIAQANSLRSLNNIIRNYRRKVGTLNNEPLASFKYKKYDKKEQILLEALLFNDKDCHEEIQALNKDITTTIEIGERQFEQRYQQNEMFKEDPKYVFEAIDRSECYCHKYYENFERSVMGAVSSIHNHFDKLNGFLSVWENVGSTKASEMKCYNDIEIEKKTREIVHSRKGNEDEQERDLEDLLRKCPPNSPLIEEYQKKLEEVKRFNEDRQKKMDMVGNMLNKKKHRQGILVNKCRDLCMVEWMIDLENNKVKPSYTEDFKAYRSDLDYSEYRPTLYELQKPFRKAEEIIKYHQQTRGRPAQMTHEWWYDRFGKDGTFDLIITGSQQVQKRIEFEVVRQTELMHADDRKKRDMVEKNYNIARENERRESMALGLKQIYEKPQIKDLISRIYSADYLPEMYEAVGEDLSFSDEEEEKKEPPPSISMHKTGKQAVPKEEEVVQAKPVEMIPLIRTQQDGPQEEDTLLSRQIEKNEAAQPEEPKEMTILERLIRTYFTEYCMKLNRRELDADSKQIILRYFDSLASVEWSEIQSETNFEKMFVVTPETMFYLCLVKSFSQPKIKCTVYTLEELSEEEVRESITEMYRDTGLVTVKIQPIYSDLEDEEKMYLLVGVIYILLKEETMPSDYEIKDYYEEGKEIVEDYNCHLHPEEADQFKSIKMRKYKASTIFQQYFRPPPKADVVGRKTEGAKAQPPPSIPQETLPQKQGSPAAPVVQKTKPVPEERADDDSDGEEAL